MKKKSHLMISPSSKNGCLECPIKGSQEAINLETITRGVCSNAYCMASVTMKHATFFEQKKEMQK